MTNSQSRILLTYTHITCKVKTGIDALSWENADEIHLHLNNFIDSGYKGVDYMFTVFFFVGKKWCLPYLIFSISKI